MWTARLQLAISILYLLVSAGICASLVGSSSGLGKGKGGAPAAVAGMTALSDEVEVGLSGVGGCAEAKALLEKEVVLPLSHPSVFFGPGCPICPPPAVLLYGPPGTGKTLLAKACAKEAGVPIIHVTAAALESKWWGETPKILQAVFDAAFKRSCIVFFDEVDGVGRERQGSDQACVYSLKCELLRHMDRVAHGTGRRFVVMACTNHLSALDPALRRRFPRQIGIGKPGLEERADILRALSSRSGPKARMHKDDLLRIAKRTEGMTGSDLQAAYSKACYAHAMTPEVVAKVKAGKIGSPSGLCRAAGPLTLRHWEQLQLENR